MSIICPWEWFPGKENLETPILAVVNAREENVNNADKNEVANLLYIYICK